MANTTKLDNTTLQVSGLDADWSLPGDVGTDFNKTGIRVQKISFYPSAADDVILIKNGAPDLNTTALAIAATATQPYLAAGKADTGNPLEFHFGDRGQNMWPFIDITDCTLNTAANARVVFHLV